ncbi:MAG TPA: DinB family protein [Gemmatimonadales bacterium]|nr:DinB family protein [Gemmatimonadales bacterium]
MRPVSLLLPLVLAAAPLAAQSRNAAPPSGAVVTSRILWQQVTRNITATAEELPDSLYNYRPTPEVRTFGQLFGHIAGSQYLFCAAAMGEPERAEDAVEKSTTSKAGLVAALKASTEYCNRAYAQSDSAASASTKLFGEQQTRLFALTMNAQHNGEHYGNLVTYLRLNGIVPVSSRPSSP